ncbi:MAG TPA: ECF-type sigma factor [Gemmatales bacterium]|nr:ECF-type sigma factor [Gemmatales bacterium]
MNETPRDHSPGCRSHINGYLVEHYDEIHAIAVRQMAKENADNSMQATALANEVACKMLDPAGNVQFKDSKHFLATARVMMQHILVDRARRRNSIKHGGQLNRQELQEDQAGSDPYQMELLILQEELQLLAEKDPLAGQIIQKRCEGYTIEEVAATLKISRSHAYHLWNFVRAWLMQKFQTDVSQKD